MRKIKTILLILIMAVSVCVFASCKSEMEKFNPNISELRSNVYEGGNENLKITAITGFRENPYILDGHCTGTVEFTVFTIEPKNFDDSKKYSYSASVNSKEYSGEFKLHPFGKSFSAEVNAKSEADTVTINITTSEGVEKFVLASVKTADMINEEKALEIATNRLKKQIKSMETGGELSAEIYIRLMANPIDHSGGYHWYVAFITEGQNIYAVLIEPVSMEIVAVRD